MDTLKELKAEDVKEIRFETMDADNNFVFRLAANVEEVYLYVDTTIDMDTKSVFIGPASSYKQIPYALDSDLIGKILKEVSEITEIDVNDLTPIAYFNASEYVRVTNEYIKPEQIERD